jgi:fumarylacetoacetase
MTDHTHDAAARSWVESANEAKCDFPVQNLAFAVFRRAGSRESFRGGVAIGDQVLDLAALSTLDVLIGTAAEAAIACQHPQLDRLFAMGPKGWHAFRHALFELLRHDANDLACHKLQNCLIPLTRAEYDLPASTRNFTDFYTSIHHATNIGRLFKRKDPLPPNYH